MNQFLISLDELDRVKRANNIHTIVELAEKTKVSRPTWTRVLKTREPKQVVLTALAELGADPQKVLVRDSRAA